MKDYKAVLERLKLGMERIKNKGWCQSQACNVKYYIDDQGEYIKVLTNFCAIGAIMYEKDESTSYFEGDGPYAGALDILSKHVRSGYSSIVQFNDADGTTKQDVLDLYARAIAEAERLCA